MTVSIIDVSRKSRVAPAAVSVVLNNRVSTVRVSPQTRERIIKAARDLGYESNAIAKSLRLRKTFTIGLVDNTNPAPPNLIQEIERRISARGYELLITAGRFQIQYEQAAIKRLLRRKVDGLLILAPAIEPGARQVLESLARTRFPIVGVGPLIARNMIGVDWDRTAAFAGLTRHLLEQGCRNLLFVGGKTPAMQARWAGICRAAGKQPRARLSRISPPPVSEAGSENMIGFLRAHLGAKHPDAAICASDHLALAVLRLARELGWRVPEEFAVTGSSALDWGFWISPALTTIRMPVEELARRAVARLFDQIDKQAGARKPRLELVPAELVIRESSLFTRRPRAATGA